MASKVMLLLTAVISKTITLYVLLFAVPTEPLNSWTSVETFMSILV